MPIIARRLKEPACTEARRLLYEVYTHQLKWQPPEQNPSNWRTIQTKEGPMFADRFDEVSQWFGAFDDSDEDALVGTVRLLPRGESEPKLELEHYVDLPSSLLSSSPLGDFEMNRLAVARPLQYLPIAMSLFKACLKALKEQQAQSLFMATGMPFPAELLKSLGFAAHGQFTYAAGDDPVCLLHLDLNHQDTISRILGQQP